MQFLISLLAIVEAERIADGDAWANRFSSSARHLLTAIEEFDYLGARFAASTNPGIRGCHRTIGKGQAVFRSAKS